MRLVWLVAFTAILTSGAAEQPAPATPSRSAVIAQRLARWPQIAAIVDRTHSVPAEFAAQALLRAAESVPDAAWRRELIDEAYQRASGAQQPLPRRVMTGATAAGSREAMIAQASTAGLDKLSLQMRAVRDMLMVDPKAARQMFLSVVKPELRTSTCKDALMDDDAAYFETLPAVLRLGFTPAEQKQQIPFELLNTQIGRISSPMEIAPAVKAMIAVLMTPEQLQIAMGTLAATVQKLQGDDRAFTWSAVAARQQIQALDDLARTRGLSTEGLDGAFRQYMAQNLGGARCQDSFPAQPATPMTGGLPARTPASDDQIKPSKVEGTAVLEPIMSRDAGSELQSRLHALLFGSGNASLTVDQKSNREWRDQFLSLLDEVNRMQPESAESEGAFFYRKCGILSVAFMAALPGPDRDRVLAVYVDFLRGSGFQQASLLEWFSQVRALATQARSLTSSEYQKVLDALVVSGNAVLGLYAAEEKNLPERPDWAQ